MVCWYAMGRHAEWRKIAKKVRRQRIRQQNAILRQAGNPVDVASADKCMDEELGAIVAENKRAHSLWVEKDREAVEEWQRKVEEARLLRLERDEQERLKNIELEREQEKLAIIKKERELEMQLQMEEFQRRQDALDVYLKTGGPIPDCLATNLETNSTKDACHFFSKTGACRYGLKCQRNHIKPQVSSVLVIPNFYTHCSLRFRDSEHGADVSLEFDHEEQSKHFEEFFTDIVLEFEKCGRIKNVFICCNVERHLRGNVYVEYSTAQEALRSFQMFNGRWYDGRQLSVEFCSIPSWSGAICGMHMRKHCPKGNTCNFLHVYRNPKGRYWKSGQEKHDFSRKRTTQARWSESPEPVRSRRSRSSSSTRHSHKRSSRNKHQSSRRKKH